jgi:anionic cell wall polymer biosynthesis LytR-Cps2A-Psr (LCP) family protein
VKNTLMKYLHGMTIDYYVAMNMDAIPILNDAVGGVTVNVKDDFSAVNPAITMGELTLQGDQVIDYVRTRKDVGDQKNVTRMERQKEYVDGFLQKLIEKEQSDVEFALRLYEQVAPYVVTDCSSTTLSGMLDRYTEFELKEVVTLEGDNVIGEDYYEFYPDEEKLDELVVRLFYAPKK